MQRGSRHVRPTGPLTVIRDVRDRELYYLRTAQGWFFLSLGTSGALLLAIGSLLS